MSNNQSRKRKYTFAIALLVLALILVQYFVISFSLLKGSIAEKHLLFAIYTLLTCIFILDIYYAVTLHNLLSSDLLGDDNAEDKS